jgi:site-specific DNA-cytosine methylase
MKHGSLFDGAGGLRLGFEQAGFETIWQIDILNGQDIRDYGKRNLEAVDVITGGPPCQRTSFLANISGRRSQESLFPEMLRVIRELGPQWVVVEQLVVDKAIITSWVQQIQRAGYGCSGRIVSSRHWLPHPRARWFIVGRMGIDGLALRNLLYDCGNGSEAIAKGPGGPGQPVPFAGSCSDCLRGGIFSRLSDRSLALMGAGNAVSVPVARWLAENIKRAESLI